MVLNNIVFMKYGSHAGETPSEIIERKKIEVTKSGYTFWGYGGTSCHPKNQIQPFINMNISYGEKTYLVLSRIDTVWRGGVSNASFFSYNKLNWLPIPEAHTIKGSKYALICRSFEECDFFIDLSLYQVPVGRSHGQLLSNYITGMNTKGCGKLVINTVETEKKVHISAIAEIETAVFIR